MGSIYNNIMDVNKGIITSIANHQTKPSQPRSFQNKIVPNFPVWSLARSLACQRPKNTASRKKRQENRKRGNQRAAPFSLLPSLWSISRFLRLPWMLCLEGEMDRVVIVSQFLCSHLWQDLSVGLSVCFEHNLCFKLEFFYGIIYLLTVVWFISSYYPYLSLSAFVSLHLFLLVFVTIFLSVLGMIHLFWWAIYESIVGIFLLVSSCLH